MNPKIIAALIGTLIVGVAIGGATVPAETVVVPSPYPVVETSPYPVPGPTVYAIPEDCQVWIDALEAEDIQGLGLIVSIYDAYLDHPEENMEQFGVRVEAILNADDYFNDPVLDDASVCDR